MVKAVLPGFAQRVENRITEAIARGEFDNLPGAGRPLDLDDDRLIPEEERIAFRILKNAGCVPPEVERFAELERLLATVETDATAGRRLRALLVRLEAEGRNATATRAWREYEEKMARRVEKK
jgi:hypothetical protein